MSTHIWRFFSRFVESWQKEDIIKIAKWISPAKKYYLQNFRAEKTITPKFERVKPYSEKYILDIAKKISPFFEICELRT